MRDDDVVTGRVKRNRLIELLLATPALFSSPLPEENLMATFNPKCYVFSACSKLTKQIQPNTGFNPKSKLYESKKRII